MEIQSTLNYELFTRIESNRKVINTHVNKLAASIARKNLLHLFPIILNNAMEIVDGQHRLSAAIKLKLPIYYMIDPYITKADIAMVNNRRKQWRTADYVHYFAYEGNPNYCKFLALKKRYPQVQWIALMRLCSKNIKGSPTSGVYDSFRLKEGLLVLDMEEFTSKVLAFCLKISRAPDNCVPYAFNSYFLYYIKKALLPWLDSRDETLDYIYDHRHAFPVNISEPARIGTIMVEMVEKIHFKVKPVKVKPAPVVINNEHSTSTSNGGRNAQLSKAAKKKALQDIQNNKDILEEYKEGDIVDKNYFKSL